MQCLVAKEEEDARIIDKKHTDNINTIKKSSYRYKHKNQNESQPSRNAVSKQYRQYMQYFPQKRKIAGFKSIRSVLSSQKEHFPNIFPTLHLQIPFLSEIEPALLQGDSDLFQNLLLKVNTCKLFSNQNSENGRKQFMNEKLNHNDSRPKIIKYQPSDDIHLTMIKYLDISNIVTRNYLVDDIRTKINKKFVLYLQGRYRALKFFQQIDSSELIPSDVCKIVRELMEIQQNTLTIIPQQQPRNSITSGGAGSSYTTCEKSVESIETHYQNNNKRRKRLRNQIEGVEDNYQMNLQIKIPQSNKQPSQKITNKKKFLADNQILSEEKSINTFTSHLQNPGFENSCEDTGLNISDYNCQSYNLVSQQEESKGEKRKVQKLKEKNDKKQQGISSTQDEEKLEELSIKFPHSNVEITKQNEEDNLNLSKESSVDNKEKRKQIFHNLSKYLMHLILEILSDDHIDSFGIIPGYSERIKKLIVLLRLSGKRNKLSQTYYFNHSHYNCIFQTFTTENIKKLLIQPEFMNIHKAVFGDIDFNNEKEVINVNIIKNIIGSIVVMQLDYLIDQIESEIDSSLFELNSINSDCQAKVNYLKSVSEGIKKLLLGNQLIRF